jgi:hypothetical protein
MLGEHRSSGEASLHAAAGGGTTPSAARELLGGADAARDAARGQRDRACGARTPRSNAPAGPHRWEPLLYSRIRGRVATGA